VRAYDSRVPLPKMTEPDRMLAELVMAQRMEALARLVPGLAHELNNPLQAIVGFSGLLANDPALPEELRSDANHLVTEATRAKAIAGHLLEFARHRPPERHPTHLGVLVDMILALQSYQLTGGIDIEVDIPADLPAVPLDRALIVQVVLNLTQNAIEALQAGAGRGKVRITGRQAEDAAGTPIARLAFADDGPGVAEPDRDHLFQQFFTTKDGAAHSGLGLFVASGIVADHGGSLRFEPGSDGGSVFTLELPLAQAGAAVAAGDDDGAGAETDGSAAARGPLPGPGTAAAVDRRLRIHVHDDDE
jgi:two-component system, NtrC family, sensor kinase